MKGSMIHDDSSTQSTPVISNDVNDCTTTAPSSNLYNYGSRRCNTSKRSARQSKEINDPKRLKVNDGKIPRYEFPTTMDGPNTYTLTSQQLLFFLRFIDDHFDEMVEHGVVKFNMPEDFKMPLETKSGRSALRQFKVRETTQTIRPGTTSGSYRLENRESNGKKGSKAYQKALSLLYWHRKSVSEAEGTDLEMKACDTFGELVDILRNSLWKGGNESIDSDVLAERTGRWASQLESLGYGKTLVKKYGQSIPGTLFPRPRNRIIQTYAASEDEVESILESGTNDHTDSDRESTISSSLSSCPAVDDYPLWDGNLAQIPDLFTEIRKAGVHFPGINSPYLYAGPDGSMFAWHKEDLDLFSLNLSHGGGIKIWFSVRDKDVAKFEALMQKLYPEDFDKCSGALRHKEFMVLPETLVQNGIEVVTTLQGPGQMVLTMPNGYHCGFNVGFTLNEAINFGHGKWVHHGVAAKGCQCNDLGPITVNGFWDKMRWQLQRVCGLNFGLTSDPDELP